MSPPPPPPPTSLKPGYYTTAAIDNIDYEPSSSTATKSFHASLFFNIAMVMKTSKLKTFS